MKIAHLADLHLGKTVNHFSMIEDQKYILNEIIEILKQEKIDVVILAGDIYDRTVPSAEATILLSDFLNALVQNGQEVIMIAGNHDSGDRLSFARDLLANMKIHICGMYEGNVPQVTLQDAYGPVHFYLLPFIRPIYVNRYIFDEKEKCTTYRDAAEYALKGLPEQKEERNLLVAHQFIAGAEIDEDGSEECMAGGLDRIPPAVFWSFDYVALGHIHRGQTAGRETIRYAGTPLKYSFAEADHRKSIPILDWHTKEDLHIYTVPLHPLHDMRILKGSFQDVMQMASSADYIKVILTDEKDVPDALYSLRSLFSNLMSLEYDNTRTRRNESVIPLEVEQKKDPFTLFAEFYQQRNGTEMDEEQKEILFSLLEEMGVEQ